MKYNIFIAFILAAFVAKTFADISADRINDAWAEYYKQYYDDLQLDSRDSGYHAPISSYLSSYSPPDYSLDVFGPENQVSLFSINNECCY